MVKVILLMLATLWAFQPAAAANPTFEILGVRYLGDLPTLVADKRAIFNENGVDVRVSYQYAGKQNLEALLNGDADFALTAHTPLVLELLRQEEDYSGPQPVVIATLTNSSDLNQIIVRKESEFVSPQSLYGRRIGLVRGTNAEFLWWMFARLNGIDSADTELVDIGVAELEQALIQGRVDAIVTWEPWSSELLAKHEGSFAKIEGANIYNAKWLLVTTDAVLEQSPQYVEKVLRSYLMAIGWANANSSRSYSLFQREHEVSVADGQNPSPTSTFSMSLNWALLTSFQLISEWAAQANLIPPISPTTRILEWVDASPLHSVDARAVTIPMRDARENSP